MAKRKFVQDPEFSYADTFDRLMEAHFGEPFKTEWDPFSGWDLFSGSFGGYQTVRVNGKKLTKQMNKVGQSISDAIAAGQGAYHHG